MMNLFAIRSRDPKILKTVEDPVGSINNTWLRRRAKKSRYILAAWGNHGLLFNRQSEVLSLLKDFDIYFLGITKRGAPKHPLRLSNNTQIKLWRAKDGNKS